MSKSACVFALLLPLLLSGASGCTPALIGPLNAANTTLSGFVYSSQTAFVQRNTVAITNVPSFATGSASSFSISPALPSGMTLNTTTGYITGTPTADTPAASTPAYSNYTVTASNAFGSITTVVKLLVMNGFVVDSTAWDATAATSDSNAGNGVCATPGGTCTLKAAMEEVNALAGAVPRSIFLNNGTYNIPSGDHVTPAGGSAMTHLVICGGSADSVILSGQNVTYVINDSAGKSLTVCNMTIRDGLESGGSGAGLYFGTLAGASLNISYVKFISNHAATWGGAVVFDSDLPGGTLTIDHTLFDSNVADIQGGGLFIVDEGTTNITYSTFQNNSTPSGGGGILMWQNNAILNVSSSTFRSNSCANSGCGGGAIQTANNNQLRVWNSTFYNNSANGATTTGGAIDITGTGTHDLRFNTFYNNTCGNAATPGGAISLANATLLTTRANIF